QGLLQAQHVAEAQQAAGRLGGSRRGRSGRRRRGGGRGGRGLLVLLVLLVLVGGGAGGGGGARGGGGGRRSGRRGRLVAAAEQAADDPADAVGQTLDQPFGGPARHTTGDAVDQATQVLGQQGAADPGHRDVRAEPGQHGDRQRAAAEQ